MRPDEIRAHHLQEIAKEAPSITEAQDLEWILEQCKEHAESGKYKACFEHFLSVRFTPRIKKHLEICGFKIEVFHTPEWKKVLFSYLEIDYIDAVVVSWEVQK